MNLDKAIDVMFVSEDEYYPTIDVGPKRIQDDNLVIFVGISGREPTSFSQTWNTPPGSGPFKVIEPLIPETGFGR